MISLPASSVAALMNLHPYKDSFTTSRRVLARYNTNITQNNIINKPVFTKDDHKESHLIYSLQKMAVYEKFIRAPKLNRKLRKDASVAIEDCCRVMNLDYKVHSKALSKCRGMFLEKQARLMYEKAYSPFLNSQKEIVFYCKVNDPTIYRSPPIDVNYRIVSKIDGETSKTVVELKNRINRFLPNAIYDRMQLAIYCIATDKDGQMCEIWEGKMKVTPMSKKMAYDLFLKYKIRLDAWVLCCKN